MITEAGAAPPPIAERVTVGEAGARLIRQLGVRGRKSSTTGNYESYLRVHLEPYFGDKALIEILPEDVEDFIQQSLDSGLAVKSTLNHLGFLHGIFEFAIRKRWAHLNPCDRAEKPGPPGHDEEIRFLDQDELEALLAAIGTDRSAHRPAAIERAARVRQLRDIECKPWSVIASEVGCAESTAIYLYRCDPELRIDDDLARVERALYLTAAMTGLRQGELLALRWADVDQPARRLRVRRNFVRGTFGTPKSRRSSRAVPLADRVAAALAELRDASAYAADDDLVFGHPHTGKPLDRSLLLKRFKRALEQAGVREIRFHEYADVRVMAMLLRRGCSERFRWSGGRHNQSASRNARSVSVGW
ncbi:MAG: tyrosine-type recombinase/integrase [Solirubrobacteraceae bacterium]